MLGLDRPQAETPAANADARLRCTIASVRAILLTSVAVTTFIAVAPKPSFADDPGLGSGGAGGAGSGGTGGTANATIVGNAGGNAPSGSRSGGGGGGAGATVSAGGAGDGPGGGAGGTSSNRDGASANAITGGGGGGGAGGNHGLVAATNGMIIGPRPGGRGGNGGNGALGGDGGGGGQGGFSLVMNGPIDFGIRIAITTNGGTGGNGGDGDGTGRGGNGGDGGHGLVATAGGSFINNGTVKGGNGGNGGASNGLGNGSGGAGGIGILGDGLSILSGETIAGGDGGAAGTGTGAPGTAGAGGVGIQGSNLTIVNAGEIRGGMSADGVRANAITFTGGTNVLELRPGYTTTGTVQASAADTLRLGTGNQAFDLSTVGSNAQYRGFGVFEKTGSGTWILNGTATAATPWTISGGTLKVGPGAALLNSSAITVNGGTFDINGNNQTIGALSGSAGGTVAVTGGTLTVGDSADTTFAGVISGSGNFKKQGTGTLTLSGNSTLLGSIAVNQGTLVLTGTTTGAVVTNSGGTLVSASTIGGNLFNSGTVSTGSAIGTLTVNNAYSQFAGAVLQIKINAAGQNDLIRANGVASLNGTLSVLAQAGTYQPDTRYTILTAAGGVMGTFSGVTSNLAFLTPSVSYGADSVTLVLSRASSAYREGGQTANQKAVGAALDLASANASGDFANVLSALNALDTTQGPKVLDTLSGQTYSGFGTAAVQSAQTFMDNFQFQAGGGQAFNTASAPAGNHVALAEACDVACDSAPALWGAWAGGLGAFGTIAGNANASGITYSLGGFSAGLDRKLGSNLLLGITTGFTAASLYGQTVPGSGTSNTVQVGLYGEWTEGPLYLDGLMGYARSDNRMTRPIVIPGLPYRAAQGHTTADQFFGQLEAGYKVGLGFWASSSVTPFARLQVSTSTQAGFTESGADSLNLTVASQTTQSLRSVLGAQLATAIDAGWRDKLNLTVRLGWSHEYGDLTRPVTASFVGAPAAGFTTQGALAPRDGAIVGLGANTRVGDATSLYARYDGDIAGANTNHILSAGVRIVW